MALPWVDYISRNSFMLQQGRHFADVAYFYGEEAPLTGLYGRKLVADAPARYGYDFINTDALTNQLTVAGDELIAKSGVAKSGARYNRRRRRRSMGRGRLPCSRSSAAPPRSSWLRLGR